MIYKMRVTLFKPIADKKIYLTAIFPLQKNASGLIKILVTEAKLGKVVVDSLQSSSRFGNNRLARYIAYASPVVAPVGILVIEHAGGDYRLSLGCANCPGSILLGVVKGNWGVYS